MHFGLSITSYGLPLIGMLKPHQNSDKIFLTLLGVITILGFALRLHGLSSESITADEASALFRLKFPSFPAMIEGGVRPDGHPAFTQVFLWFWTKCFGWSEFSIRIPFALFGTASIWLSGIIGRKWFSNSTGLATAIGIAFLQFPLMYSQLARPYAPGLFFTLLAVYFLSRFINENSTHKRDIIGFAFAAALAAYSHYFSLLTTTLIAFVGLFFVAKKMRLKYLLACAMAVLLFLPHLSITLSQIEIGGIGGPNGWLGKPTPAFLLDHLRFAFDGSRGLMFISFIVCCLSFVVFYKRPDKFQLLALLIWILPMVIGYVYSIEKNPVLQNSVLLFGFPFLLMFLFSRLPDFNSKKIAIIFPAGFAIVFFSYVTFYKPYHLSDHFGRLKELVSIALDWQEKAAMDGKNADVFYNVDGPFMLEYNCDRIGKCPENILGTINNGQNELVGFRNIVENSNTDYFIYGWSTKYSPLEILPIIQEKFPFLIKKNEWFNSAIYIFSTHSPADKLIEKNRIFESDKIFEDSPLSELEFDSTNKQRETSNWSKPCKVEMIDTSQQNFPSDIVNGHYTPHIDLSPNYQIRLDSTCIYSPSLKKKVGDILINPDNEIFFTAHVKLLDSLSNIILVIEFQRDGKQLYWNGMESTTQINPMNWNQRQHVYFGLRLPSDLLLTDTVNFYCYSKNGLPILIDYLQVKTLKGHPNIYGPRPGFK